MCVSAKNTNEVRACTANMADMMTDATRRSSLAEEKAFIVATVVVSGASGFLKITMMAARSLVARGLHGRRAFSSLRSDPQGLLARLLDVAPKDTEMDDAERFVPISSYTCERQLAREKNILFKQYPLIVGHSSMFNEPGDYLSLDLGDVPVLINKGRDDGVLRAFINVCRHRGTRLVPVGRGSTRAKRIVCPYHAWAYDATTGDLAFVPHAKGFDPAKCADRGLVRLPLAERHGFVFVTPTPSSSDVEAAAPDLDTFLGPTLDGDLAALDLGSHALFDERRFERSMGWKLVVDSALENYHVRVAHKDTIAAMFLDTVAIFDVLQAVGHSRLFLPKKSLRTLLTDDDPATGGEALPLLREHSNILYYIFPNTILLVQPDHVSWLRVYPRTTDRTLFEGGTLVPRALNTPDKEAYWAKNVEIFYDAVDEDWVLGESIQEGLRSNANTHMVFGRYEQLLGEFHDAVMRTCVGDET